MDQSTRTTTDDQGYQKNQGDQRNQRIRGARGPGCEEAGVTMEKNQKETPEMDYRQNLPAVNLECADPAHYLL